MPATNPRGHNGKLRFLSDLRLQATRLLDPGAVPRPPLQVEERRRVRGWLQDDGPERHWEPDRNLQRRSLSAYREGGEVEKRVRREGPKE